MGCVELETGIREEELAFRGSHGGRRAEEWTSAMVAVCNKILHFFLWSPGQMTKLPSVLRPQNLDATVLTCGVVDVLFFFSPVSSDNPVCKHLLNYRYQQLCSLG